MNNYPESQLTEYQEKGYQIQEILGTNKAGGRVTYLATETHQNKPVVIKEFQFAKSQSTWSDYEAYEREIQVLKQLSYPNIPQYLATIETPCGFALVQEYKKAIPLSQIEDLTLDEIKEIATQILEILVYLQSHKPPIYHRDIKPENILIDRTNNLEVYLIDFGFARKGGDNIAMSSVVKGTLGFMPPEQLYNQKLTNASDLYSLGMTLISLLTKTASYKIGELIDHQGKLNYKKHLAFNLERKLIKWLDKMIETNLNYRFPDAQTALSALKNLNNFSWLALPKPALISGISKSLIVVILLLFGYHLFNNKNSKPPIVTDPIIENPDPDILVEQLKQTKQCIKCDLSGVNLSAMYLEGVNLEGATLTNANLKGIHLKNANLTNANLTNTDLTNADLTNANLTNAKLNNADLTESYFGNADLINAKLNNANLTKTDFVNADLRGAKINLNEIKDDNLKGAILPE